MKRLQIHATNINGLGASQVVISFLDAYANKNGFEKMIIHLPKDGVLANYKPEKGIVKRFTRILPNSVSRLLECLFSKVFFADVPTIVLGDIPLRGISSQIVLVHQPNLIKPSINSFSSRSLKFKINRLLFSVNQKFAKKIIVQTGAMAKDLIASYPKIKDKVLVLPQPVPKWLLKNNKVRKQNKKVILFYPSAFYPHKKHDFLKDINQYYSDINIENFNFEIYLTLTDEEFLPLKGIRFIKNLGRLSVEEMNDYYSRVDALLFLSSMESYGLPLVEAITLNMPILVAEFNYSKWLCEDSVYYFKPYEAKSFVSKMNELIENTNNGKEINYEEILHKFPKSWTNVVDEFNNALEFKL